MTKIPLLIFLFFMGLTRLHAVNDKYYAGMRALGMANATVASVDAWSGINNPSAIAFLDKNVIAASYKSIYMIQEIGVSHALFNWHTSKGSVGLNFQYQGFAGYSDINAGLYYARKFGDHFSAALQFTSLMVKPSELEKQNYLFTADASLSYHPTDKLFIGVDVFNPFSVQYETLYYTEQVPVSMRLGMEYWFAKNVSFCLEAEGNSTYPLNVKTGIEYQIHSLLALRMGAATEPKQICFGIACNIKGCSVEMAIQQFVQNQRHAGVSLSYAF